MVSAEASPTVLVIIMPARFVSKKVLFWELKKNIWVRVAHTDDEIRKGKVHTLYMTQRSDKYEAFRSRLGAHPFR